MELVHDGEIDRGSTTPGDALAVIWRHKWTVILTFLIIVSAVMATAYLSPKVYQSDAKLLDRVGRESLALDPTVVGPTLDVSQSRENEVNSELAILRSRLLAERVVDAVGVEPILRGLAATPERGGAIRKGQAAAAEPPGLLERLDFQPILPGREKAVEKFMKNLKVEVEGRSNIIAVSYQAATPEIARDALDELIRNYLTRHVEVHGFQATPAFFQDQVAHMGDTLRVKEEEIAKFRAEHGIAALDRQKDVAVTQIGSLEGTVAEAASRVSASEARISMLSRSLDRHSPKMELSRTEGKTNYAADGLKGKLAELRLKEADLVARYNENERPVLQVREQIRLMEGTLNREKETLTEIMTGLDTNYQAIRLALETEMAQLKAESARKESLAKSLERQKVDLAELAGQEPALTRLEREAKLMEGEYTRGMENLQRARINAALDTGKVSNISIVQPATLSRLPVKPRKMLMAGVAVFLGMLGGVSLAFLAESGGKRSHA